MLVEPVSISSGVAQVSFAGAGAPQSLAAKMAQSASQADSQHDAIKAHTMEQHDGSTQLGVPCTSKQPPVAFTQGRAHVAAVSTFIQYLPLAQSIVWLEIIPLAPGAITIQYCAGATQVQSRPEEQAAALTSTRPPGKEVSVEFVGTRAANTGCADASVTETFTNPSRSVSALRRSMAYTSTSTCEEPLSLVVNIFPHMVACVGIVWGVLGPTLSGRMLGSLVSVEQLSLSLLAPAGHVKVQFELHNCTATNAQRSSQITSQQLGDPAHTN